MSVSPDTLQLLGPDGSVVRSEQNEKYWEIAQGLSEDSLLLMYKTMTITRALDLEAGNLQRQGQMALWVPSVGQEACQVGAALGIRDQDTIFPAYREHSIARLRGLSMLQIVRMLRGLTHGGWDPSEYGNFRVYTLVIAAHTLHAAGYAMGIALDGKSGTGNIDSDEAAIVFFGDGATSQGDAHEAMVYAQSFGAPLLFFLQNNHWAISTPVRVQSKTPLYLRAAGYGIPSKQIDGNDVLVSYAVSRERMDAARSGEGPQFIEALTYRMGAHTTSDDPTKYRDEAELEFWQTRDPINRFRNYLSGVGVAEKFFSDVDAQARDETSDFRRDVMALPAPPSSAIFDHVYSAPHAVIDAQREWLHEFEASFVPEGEPRD